MKQLSTWVVAILGTVMLVAALRSFDWAEDQTVAPRITTREASPACVDVRKRIAEKKKGDLVESGELYSLFDLQKVELRECGSIRA